MTLRNTRALDASPEAILLAASLLREGGLVAMPTETVYGLAANALDGQAVASIFVAKQRPSWDPLIVHVDSMAMLECVVASISPVAKALVEAFWPGPLTLLLPRAGGIPDAVTAGRPLVGVRWPAHPVAQALITTAGVPLAAPSANRFGHISPSTAAHVLADLNGRIDAVVDGGPTSIGVESTVLDPNTTPITIYRPGAVSAADVQRVTGAQVSLYQPAASPAVRHEALPSPGVGIRHYAPRATLELVHSEAELYERSLAAPAKTAVLLPRDWRVAAGLSTEPWGEWDDTAELAHNLYAALRALDATGASHILAPLPDERPNDDLRTALRDRLRKGSMPE